MRSLITTNLVLATYVISECEQFRSREKQEIKCEKVTENAKRQDVLEQTAKRKRASDDKT